jgi:hypothetical protein
MPYLFLIADIETIHPPAQQNWKYYNFYVKIFFSRNIIIKQNILQGTGLC